VGYYAVYHVAWLGWDLVEPVTYTVGQGSFILGLLYVMNNRGADVEYSDLEKSFSSGREKIWLEKFDFDIKRHQFLKRSLLRLDE